MKRTTLKSMRIIVSSLVIVTLSTGIIVASASGNRIDDAEQGQSRGDSPPTIETPLPYYGDSGAIRYYTFTNRKFKPVYVNQYVNYQIKLQTNVYILTEPNIPKTGTATLRLFNCNLGNYVGNGITKGTTTSLISIEATNSQLNSSHYYAGFLSKSAPNPNNQLYQSGIICTKGAG